MILSRQEAELIQHDQKICVRQETAAPYEGDLSGARRSDVPYPFQRTEEEERCGLSALKGRFSSSAIIKPATAAPGADEG